jgi:hypothetical protein
MHILHGNKYRLIVLVPTIELNKAVLELSQG